MRLPLADGSDEEETREICDGLKGDAESERDVLGTTQGMAEYEDC